MSAGPDNPSPLSASETRRGLGSGSDRRFLAALILLGGTYVVLLLAMSLVKMACWSQQLLKKH